MQRYHWGMHRWVCMDHAIPRVTKELKKCMESRLGTGDRGIPRLQDCRVVLYYNHTVVDRVG